MPSPDLIHLLKRPYWQALTVFEAITVILVLVAVQHPGYEPIGAFLALMGCSVFAFLCLGALFSASLREEVVRPEAVIEPRHSFFLGCSGVIAVIGALAAVAYMVSVFL